MSDLAAIAREQNQRDRLAPIVDPGILRQVAAKVAAWREAQPTRRALRLKPHEVVTLARSA